MEIPIIHSQRLFLQAISGIAKTGIEQSEKNSDISRTVVPNEAVVYKSKDHKTVMVELEHAHHNNGMLLIEF